MNKKSDKLALFMSYAVQKIMIKHEGSPKTFDNMAGGFCFTFAIKSKEIDDFMFQLSKEEFDILRSQNATSSLKARRYLPYVFTEQGVYMLATVLKGDVARDVTISIMRTFTKIREFALSYDTLVKDKN